MDFFVRPFVNSIWSLLPIGRFQWVSVRLFGASDLIKVLESANDKTKDVAEIE